MSIENPVIAEILRGNIVESQHRGAFAVVGGDGSLVLSSGDISRDVFPRSAVKAFQCVPVIESGAADQFGFTEEEIALCCASHDAEDEHVRVASSMLAKIGLKPADYECGAHWPAAEATRNNLIRAGEGPRQIDNNCSGKHAGMLAVAKQLGAPVQGYVKPDHPVQKAIAEAIGHYCEVDMEKAPMGIDGCSVPTWAMPLQNAAHGFARLFAKDNATGQRIFQAVSKNPLMVAGSKRFDTLIMKAVPRLFIKIGAEGVFCGAIPHAGLGFAMKCDDGGTRAVELAVARMLTKLDVWTPEEHEAILGFAWKPMQNWRKIEVGVQRSNF